jgi:hypothetical protein
MARNLGTTRYNFAVEWIAMNDDPTCRDVETIAQLISVALIADTFERDPATVACDVLHVREKE